MRANIKRFHTKKRNQFQNLIKDEKFDLTFNLWNHKLLIVDPVRGRNCIHYAFTDLRVMYLNKITEHSFKCPICNDIV